jgi:eukaryotic-like serine/threonine-protein kinase
MTTTLATMFGPFHDNDPTMSANVDTLSVPDIDPSPPTSSPGPRYSVRSVLGRGGMGEVRLCRDARMGRDVAIKVSLRASDSTRARFIREARVQGQLEHPAIVPVHDLEILDDGSAYFAMKRVRGKTLAELLAERDPEKRLPLRKLLGAFTSICLAVEFAHDKGVVHRDIKPGNIMLGDFGEVYLLDWGLAKVTGRAASPGDGELDELHELEPAPAATAAGSLLGTPGYMAPEQINPELGEVGPAADIYALGALLFEMVAGVPYIGADNAMEATVLTLKGVERHPAARAPDRGIPAALDALCAQALSLEPAARQGSARELADAIDRFLAGEHDQLRRREMARHHLDAAERALELDPSHARPAALHDLGLALALDPENADARRALLRLLTSPPREVPPEVKERIAADVADQMRYVSKLTALTALTYIALAPFAWLVGLREPGYFFLALGGIVCAMGIHLFVSQSARPSIALQYLAMAVILAAHLVFARFAGFLVVLPALLVAFSAARQSHPDLTHRRVGAGASCAVLAIAFFLDLRDGTYAFVDGGLFVKEQLMKLDRAALVFFFAGTIGTIVTPAVFLNRTRMALERAEQRLHIQTWQLEQLARR